MLRGDVHLITKHHECHTYVSVAGATVEHISTV